MLQHLWTRIRTRNLFFEVIALAAILAGFSLVIDHINTTDWKEFFLGNSDMLTLSLVWQSITSSEPFHWVFSSQIFIFPELPLYALASLFGGSFKTTLIINAFFNITLVYVLFRAIIGVVSRNKIVNISFSLLVTLTILGLMAIEHREGGNLAMYMFVTTAYYGVILSSLFVLYTTLLLTKNLPVKEKLQKNRLLLGLAFAVSLLTGISNPLFFLQFSAPLLVVLVFLLVLKVITKKTFIWLASIQVSAVILSVIVRNVFLSQYFSPLGEITNYIRTQNIIPAIQTYIDIVQQMLSGSIKQKAEVVLIGIVVLGACALFVRTLYVIKTSRTPKKKSLSDTDILLIAIGCLAPIATIAGAIVTGNPLTRYLLPVLFFTPLAFIPLYSAIAQKYTYAIKIGLCVAVAFLLGIALLKQPVKNLTELKNYYHPGAQCLDTHLAGTPHRAGIAQYWRARVLQLNSRDDHTIVQTDGSLKRFGWLYNNASYDLYDLSFVVVDKPERTTSQEITTIGGFPIPASAVLFALGQPNAIYNCSDFDIYTYDDNNPGKEILNRTVRDRNMGL